MSNQLKGKVALITGASKGIGAGIAKEFAAEGASVVVNYSSSKKEADNVVKEISKNGGKAIAVQANIANPDEIKQLFKETKKAFGKLDILVNNAGIYDFTSIENETPEHIKKTFDINVFGLYLASQEAVKLFGSGGGCIINISSVASVARFPNFSFYCGTKAAVDAFTRTLATELGPKKIRVNSINPGVIETEGLHATGLFDSFSKEVEPQIPLGRVGTPADIAPAAVFLASDKASWITGTTLFIDGGFR